METATVATTGSSGAGGGDVEFTMALLREQDVLYSRLERLAERQHGLIGGDSPEQLLSVLTERAEVSRGLARIAEKLAPSRANWAAHRNRFNDAQRIEADRLLSMTRGRLSRLMAGDERDVRLLSVRAGRVGEELRTSFRHGRAVEAYRAGLNEAGVPDEGGLERSA
jgi:hypothetical protein